MQYDRPLSAIVPGSRSARPSLPGWRRTSYAVRPAPQRHRTQLTVRLVHPFQGGDERLVHHDRPLSAIVSSSRFGSPIPSRMATTVLCSMIGPSAPSYPVHGSARPFPPGWRRPSYAVRPAPQRHRTQLTVRLVHPFQGGDERLVHHDRPLSAIVSSSRFGSPIPSRMATTVLCSMIGPSAPSYPVHGSARPFPPGWRRPSYAVRPAPQRHRTLLTVRLVHPFQGGDERLVHHDRPLSAIVSSSRFGSPIPFQDGDDRLMQYDRPLSAIVPGSRSARPSLPGRRRTSYASRSAP
ncbi:unnamed protein product [Cuscuta epithymum]|uniref:Uncharacterized protein n=1 Tax=Cuscuta epithymum TaxID=186058 RepID=A0AAV0CG82_9ASTE|nr:unnamed protein product [Cuscuta epithymum]